MSGLNPFRPRKSENIPGHHHSSSPSITTNYFSAPLPTAAPVANTASVSKEFNSSTVTPHESLARDVDDSDSSDEQSVSDPFHHDSYANDSDDDATQDSNGPRYGTLNPSPYPREFPEDDRPQLQAPGRAAPHPAPSSNLSPPTTATAPSAASAVGIGSKEHPDESEGYFGTSQNSTTANPNILVQSLGTRTASSSSTDVSQFSIHTGTSNHPLTDKFHSNVDVESKPFTSRPSNREKKPPPPPKSHHGKRIISSPVISPSPLQTTSTKPSNRFSFHGSSPESSFSHTPATSSQPSRKSYQPGTGYFPPVAKNHETQPSESLRRSQSQYKRPPTPPLSRRHSQMRRSKSTFSKPNPSRLSLPPGSLEVNAGPPSPIIRSSASSLHRNSRSSMQFQDEDAMDSTNLSAAEPSNSTSSSISRINPVRRVSQTSSLTASAAPPPPPPRRVRGSSNHSNDSARPVSISSEKKADEEFVPYPSNAYDILADLSRLQKEVDDLRGHLRD
ncbi:hypothetical protein ASPWEDRAFT_42197 [Aspergillus wentii DTO 134E9]|uniref:Uncharacterized protein n=1 Tax=Aspergillus wentii DTO 134E9 TaxID=1073089 RepID=A0A1L9RHB9_ASPWE|nr:uncharacterized protein ASPWEDRAFT_42197 [Aspergillus wentii DTO 134E9]KAI9928021.1 hypothetical protein MW887_002873 [Aspergillus wentii]OJJ34247.1 hypothetical protein ASPWEDRAFT_42197 [Aspergillus wentii DTO 134E9]